METFLRLFGTEKELRHSAGSAREADLGRYKVCPGAGSRLRQRGGLKSNCA